MSKTACKSVDEYIASQPEAVQEILQRVRHTIRKAVPAAEESISYKMPTYKLQGGAVLYFAGWQRHFSLYPVSARMLTAFKKDFEPYTVNKGTIRFPLSEPVPVRLIAAIAKVRAQEVAGREDTRAAALKKT